MTDEPLEDGQQEYDYEKIINRLRREYWDEQIFLAAKHLLGLTIGLSVAVAATSLGLFYVRTGQIVEVFVASLLGWAGYLFAHYSVTGKFVDQPLQQRVIPKSRKKLFGALGGFVLAAAGFAIVTVSYGNGDLIATHLGVGLGLLGYLIAHYELTGLPL